MQLNQVTVPAVSIADSKDFYLRLGLKLIVDAPHYARFEVEGGSTFSIHHAELLGDGERAVVYFECVDLDDRVEALRQAGLVFDQLPRDEPWLWREARLRDPSGNPICLYWAGENRLNPPWRVSLDQ